MGKINEAAKEQAPILSAELAELRKLAEAASPGPWRGDRYDGTVKYDLLDANDEPVISGDNGNSDNGPYGIRNEADEKYLLAANPAVILRLLDALAAAAAVPAQEQAASCPVGEAGTMPGTAGFTMACFKADEVPVGTKLYTTPPAAPQPRELTDAILALNCTNEQADIHQSPLSFRAGFHAGLSAAADLAAPAQKEGAAPVDGKEELAAALEGALAVIEDYLEYEHNGDPWTEDARAMGEMDIDDYQRDGRLEAARVALAKAKAAPVAPHQEGEA